MLTDSVALEAAMGAALDEARIAARIGEVPVGAVVVVEGSVVAQRHNERELGGDPTAHAELLALRDAIGVCGSRAMAGATIVVTLEPCPMCAGAIREAGVGAVAFGAADPQTGAGGSRYDVLGDLRLGPPPAVRAGVRAAEAAELLRMFFSARRGRGAGDAINRP
jgi:tRNA(adenine34) deaminase